MGTVYLARHVSRSEVVVVKAIHKEVAADPSFREYFDREIASLSALRHPNIVALLGYDFNDRNGPCLVMECIPGVTLDALRARHKRLPPNQVNRLLVPLCQALNYGHARQVVHRDIKPENIMVTDPDTEHESVKVMDFGLAQLATKPYIPLGKLKGSRTGEVCGTPMYLAPEGLRGDSVDHRADIYSVGVVLYELLAGVPPFNFADSAVVMNAHLHDAPPRFAQVCRDARIAPDVEALVQQCLAKFPNERPQTARELAERFGRAVNIPLSRDAFPVEAAAAAPARAPEPAQARPKPGPNAVTQSFDAWMPEAIAAIKLRGFVEDAGGEILASEPGMIRVQIGRKPQPAAEPSGGTLRSWFKPAPAAPVKSGLPTPDPIQMIIYMARKPGGSSNQLELTVVLEPSKRGSLFHPKDFGPRCDRLFHELRAYLMAGG